MDDPEVATKAPESDAMEDAAQVPEEASAQNNSGLCDQCTSDRPAPPGAAPTGEITKMDDVDVYVSKPSDYPHLSSKLLLFLTGGTGLHSVNNQLQADKYAREGFLVIMPDMFGNDPAPNSSSNMEESSQSIIDLIKLRAAETAKSFLIDMWLARHTPEKILPILHRVLEAARTEFADAVAGGGGIYGVGYCIGAKYILQLAGAKADDEASGRKPTDEESGFITSEPLLKCGAAAHGTLISKEDFEGLRSPVMLVCIQDDQLFPEDIRVAGEELLRHSNVDHKFEIYPGVPHGFAVVGEYESPKIKAAQEQAFAQMLEWLKNH
ncbi:MAG: hypothetical protein M1818_004546 [Claussenomyces sp. TS43310]|nr:MAG: hypothetical protein M1818_004546 [Claussenomyces sp. TS43310]